MKESLRRILCPLLLLLLLLGCGKKQMDIDTLLLYNEQQNAVRSIAFSAGDRRSFTAALPDCGKRVPTLAVQSDNDTLAVTQSDGGAIEMTCAQPGSYTLTLLVTCDGYVPLQKEYAVTVSLRKMALRYALEGGDGAVAGDTLTLSRGGEQQLVLTAEQGAQLSALPDNPAVLACAQNEQGFLLTARYPGETTLTLTAKKPGYETATQALRVKVNATPAALQVANQTLWATVGQTLSFGFSAQQGGSVTAACADPNAAVRVSGGVVSVTAQQAGSYTVEIACSADGYATATQTVTAVFSLSPAPMSAPASVRLTAGKVATVQVTDFAAGTAFSLKVSGDIYASITGAGALSIEAGKPGNAEVTVTASCAGYSDSAITIPVTIQAVTVTVSNRYADVAKEIMRLINVERRNAGISQLQYLTDLDTSCQLRAQEASQLWSHTRPNGSGWETVLDELGLSYQSKGENLFASNILDAAVAVEGWMSSPGHRENILRPEFQAAAVGIVRGSDGDYYICQHFVHY